ncbi:LOB domain-containing protein [Drosera capensis]
MSCNGCRILRKGCSETCVLRPCLQWIESAESQSHATVFLAKFFGRAGLINFISNVPSSHRPALFQSLLYEACGRTVNPVNGAVGLLSTGNWHVCQAAVDNVLRGGVLRPIPEFLHHRISPPLPFSDDNVSDTTANKNNRSRRISEDDSALRSAKSRTSAASFDLSLAPPLVFGESTAAAATPSRNSEESSAISSTASPAITRESIESGFGGVPESKTTTLLLFS